MIQAALGNLDKGTKSQKRHCSRRSGLSSIQGSPAKYKKRERKLKGAKQRENLMGRVGSRSLGDLESVGFVRKPCFIFV